MDELIKNLRLLARTRGIKKSVDARWKALNDRVKNSKKYKELKEDRTEYAKFVKEYEDNVRAEAVKLYDGKEKQITEGVSIRTSVVYEYHDADAMTFVEDELKVALVTTFDRGLLKAALENMDKGNRLPAWVEKKEVNSAAIASDLSFLFDYDKDKADE